MEYLPFNETVQALDKGQRFEAEARRYMAEKGYPSLAQHGLQKALRGVTSLAEVVRVCGA
jgi:general secretion pathway protein E